MSVMLDLFKRIVGVQWREDETETETETEVVYYIFAYNGNGGPEEPFVGANDVLWSTQGAGVLAEVGVDVQIGPTPDFTSVQAAFDSAVDERPPKAFYVLTSTNLSLPFEEWDILQQNAGWLPYGLAAGVNFFGTPNVNCPPPFYFHGARFSSIEHAENYSVYARTQPDAPYDTGSHSVVEYDFGGDPEVDFTVISCSSA